MGWGQKCHGHEILKPLPIVKSLGICIFLVKFQADYVLYLLILLLSTTVKNGEGGQNIMP